MYSCLYVSVTSDVFVVILIWYLFVYCCAKEVTEAKLNDTELHESVWLVGMTPLVIDYIQFIKVWSSFYIVTPPLTYNLRMKPSSNYFTVSKAVFCFWSCFRPTIYNDHVSFLWAAQISKQYNLTREWLAGW